MFNLTEREPRKVYLERFVMMALLLVPSVFLQGNRGAFITAASILACMITDAVCCFLRKMRYDIKDSAVPFWGMAAALMMPSTIPLGLVILSSVLCIAVGKHLFGGSDNIIFCPPAISVAFLIICYPADMLYFPRYGFKVDVFEKYSGTLSRSLEYSLHLHNVPSQSLGDILMGLIPGAIASVYTAVILICGVCMIFRRSNSGFVVIPCLLTAGLLAFLFPRAGVSGFNSMIYELSSEYLVFGTVFLAAEPYRIPQKNAGKILYGIMLGYTTMMFRFFGKTEGSFLFALLITCALGSSFDRVVENVIYWKKTYLNTFEKSKTQIQGGTVKLTDTQEIVLPEKYRFNTPPIDNKITKKRRTHKKDTDGGNDATDKDREIMAADNTSAGYDEPDVKLYGAEKNKPESKIAKLKRLRTKNKTRTDNVTEEETHEDEHAGMSADTDNMDNTENREDINDEQE